MVGACNGPSLTRARGRVHRATEISGACASPCPCRAALQGAGVFVNFVREVGSSGVASTEPRIYMPVSVAGLSRDALRRRPRLLQQEAVGQDLPRTLILGDKVTSRRPEHQPAAAADRGRLLASAASVSSHSTAPAHIALENVIEPRANSSRSRHQPEGKPQWERRGAGAARPGYERDGIEPSTRPTGRTR